jgi:hypothetical protein
MRKNSAVVYYRTTAATVVATMVAYPSSAAIMGISPYLALFLAAVLLFLCIPLILLLPETVYKNPEPQTIVEDNSTQIQGNTFLTRRKGDLSNLIKSASWLFDCSAVLYLLPSSFVNNVDLTAISFLLQYGCVRFNWSFEKVNCI